MEINNIYNLDALEYLKTLKDNSVDLIFTDPPYALGSEIIIQENGKPEYSKAADFMAKWNQPNGGFWEAWFKEAKRVLKFGGHCLVFGIDRQTFLYKYFACYAGFTEKQSLYWYFISNFPKASDLSKNLDKNTGAEREVVGVNKGAGSQSEYDNTIPKTDIAKKYDGYKYSIAPLKQTNETIMIFQKPYKTGSCLHDIIAMENGDDTITCGALGIENNRIGIKSITSNAGNKNGKHTSILKGKDWEETTHTGRFPSQTFIDSNTKEILDGQSGFKKGDSRDFVKVALSRSEIFKGKGSKDIRTYNDTNGRSKSVHVCDYEAGDYDIYIYSPKVSNEERNKGLSGMENMSRFHNVAENNHPTVKPLKLLQRVLKYFKTPNPQIVLDCFVGSGSIPIAAIKEGYDYIGTELNADYFEIAQKRIFEAKRQTKLF